MDFLIPKKNLTKTTFWNCLKSADPTILKDVAVPWCGCGTSSSHGDPDICLRYYNPEYPQHRMWTPSPDPVPPCNTQHPPSQFFRFFCFPFGSSAKDSPNWFSPEFVYLFPRVFAPCHNFPYLSWCATECHQCVLTSFGQNSCVLIKVLCWCCIRSKLRNFSFPCVRIIDNTLFYEIFHFWNLLKIILKFLFQV